MAVTFSGAKRVARYLHGKCGSTPHPFSAAAETGRLRSQPPQRNRACPNLYVRLAKPMNRFAACGDPRADKGQRTAKMTKDEMIGLFKSAPMGSRHQRMLWAAHKIAGLTGATEGGTYQMLLVALIEAEKQLDPREFNDCA